MTIDYIKNYVPKTEDQFQTAVTLMISQNFPQLRFKFWHTKNESWIRRIAIKISKTISDSVYSNWRVETESEFENRRIKEGAQNKAKGMTSGVMDILIVHLGILYKIELKIEGGKLSESQIHLHKIWNNDCPEVPVMVFYDLYSVYEYCCWIISNNLRIIKVK